jgi:hypothetical protein
VFFLGLLSTPLPYLLLAAFYFFGFAMGMFNNSTGEEAIETASSVTIPVEVNQKTAEPSVFYYQAYNDQVQHQTEKIQSDHQISIFFPDSGILKYELRNMDVSEFHSQGFHFSRPPPSGC